jgi:hypothetical protein
MVSKSTDKHLAEREREREHLHDSLNWLESEGRKSPSDKYEMIAENKVLSELGHFREDQQRDADWMEGFIIRTRKDCIQVKLEVANIIDRFHEIEKRVTWVLVLCGALFIGTILRQWWG